MLTPNVIHKFGPEIENIPDLKRRSHFKSYALGGKDAPNQSPPVYTLATLMAQNNHTFIDILKIDIEGAEFATLDSLMDAYPSAFNAQGARDAGITGGGLPFGQLQLEIHARDSEYASFPRFQEWWEKMERAGLRPFWTEPNLVYVNLVTGVKPTLAEVRWESLPSPLQILTVAPLPLVLIHKHPWKARACFRLLSALIYSRSTRLYQTKRSPSIFTFFNMCWRSELAFELKFNFTSAAPENLHLHLDQYISRTSKLVYGYTPY